MQISEFFYTPLLLLPSLAFLCLLHGMLINSLLLRYGAYCLFVNNTLGYIVSAFIGSLFINAVIILILSFFQLHIYFLGYILLIIDVFLILLIVFFRGIVYTHFLKIFKISVAQLVFVLFAVLAFYMMMYQGGLIDSLADGWWHMSMAQRIVAEGSVFYENHHLTGQTKAQWSVDYPFLWHAHIALLHMISGMSIPVIWHAIAASVVFLTLLAYFVLAKAFTRNEWVALFSVICFCLFYGGINSYFRVMSWPGNVAYIGLYFGIALFVQFVGLMFSSHHGQHVLNKFVVSKYRAGACLLSMLLVLVFVTSLLHGVATALLALSMAFSVYGVALFALLQNKYIKQIFILIALVGIIGLIGLSVAMMWFPAYVLNALSSLGQIHWSFFVLVLMPFVIGFYIGRCAGEYSGNIGFLLMFFVVAGFLILFVDWQHFGNLFAVQQLNIVNRLEYASSLLGSENMQLPHWPHQLKGALLFSGLLSIFFMPLFLCFRYHIGVICLLSNAFFAFVCLISPEVFRLLETVIYASSLYRVQVLIFAPIMIAWGLYLCCEVFKRSWRDRLYER